MGLTGQTSWTVSSTTNVTRYYDNKSVGTWSINGKNRQIYAYYYNNVNQTAIPAVSYYLNKASFKITTDSAGCSQLNFSCSGARSGSGKLYWKVTEEQTTGTGSMTICSYSNSTWSGTLTEASLLPNTTYYVLFWASMPSGTNLTVDLSGTMYITGSGTYGSPGDIVANDTEFNNPINMSFGSETEGGHYTVSVQMEDSQAIVLQNYDNIVESTVTITSYSGDIAPTVNNQVFQRAVNNTEGNYKFLYIKIQTSNGSGQYTISYIWNFYELLDNTWVLVVSGVDLSDYGITLNEESYSGYEIQVHFTAEYDYGARTELTWTPTLAQYGSVYTDEAIVVCYITVQTYFGGVLSGERTAEVNVSFNESIVGPVISQNVFSIEPLNLNAIAGLSGYIQNYSKIRASFDSTGGITYYYGATFAKWSVKFGSNSIIDVSDISTAYVDSSIIEQNTTVLLTLTDSRGFTASVSLSATITPYQNPQFAENIFYRSDALSVESDEGAYLYSSFDLLYASINGQNLIDVKLYTKRRDASSYDTPVTISNGTTTVVGTNKIFEAEYLKSNFGNYSYDVRIIATDSLGNTSIYNYILDSPKWALHIRNGGTGAAFGKAAENDEELDIADWSLNCGEIIFNDSAISLAAYMFPLKLSFTNTSVAASSFVSDATYQDYPYRAAIPLTGVASTMIPEVAFDVVEATSGNYAPLAITYGGNVSVDSSGTTATVVSITQELFRHAVNNVSGTYAFSYDGISWILNSNAVELEKYGISTYGDEVSGDTISIAYAVGGIYIYAEDPPTGSITIPTIICWK